MVPTWIQSVELAVQHMGQPGHGVPVARMARREGPGDTLCGQSLLDVPIVADVLHPTVTVVHEVICKRI